MASPSTIITLGLGSFGAASLVITLGYGISSAGPGFKILLSSAITRTVAGVSPITKRAVISSAITRTVNLNSFNDAGTA